MSFETSIHCDGCGDTVYTVSIAPKWLIVKMARERGWSVEKYHLCPKCKKKRMQLKKGGWLN